MDTRQTFQDYDRAVAGLGRVIERGVTQGVPYARVRIDGGLLKGGWNSAKLLMRLAEQDARRPEVAMIAAEARRMCGSDPDVLARFLHAFVQERVTFAREPGERFQSTAVSFAWGAGDCDDSARALFALARAAGLPARLCFLVQQGQPAHVFAQVGRGYHNAETTIAALFGEHPLAAAKRLGVQTRPDLSGRAVTLGSIGPSLIAPAPGALVRSAFAIRNGDRVRMILEVSMLASRESIRQGLVAVGFSPSATVYEDRAELDLLEWPASWLDDTSASPASSGKALVYADATYAGDASQLNRTLDFAFVRDARKVLMENSQSAPATPAPAAVDPNAKPLTAEQLLPQLPDPTDKTSSRSEWARRALMAGWFQVFGSDASAPYSPAVEQAVLAIAAVETDLGRSVWDDAIDGDGYSLRWNFGNVHCGSTATGVCVSGCKKHGDTDHSGHGYVTCFAAYKSAVDGMAGLVRTLCGKGRENTRAALLSGDATKVASAMRENGYYGFAPPRGDATDAVRDRYAKLIEDQSKVIAGKLGTSQAVAVGGVGPNWAAWLGLTAIAVGTAAAAYYAHRGG